MTTHSITTDTLRRPVEGRIVAGVAAGLARHFDLDVTLVRLGIAVLTVLGGAGIPLYIAAWLLIPEDGRDTSVLADLLSPVCSPSPEGGRDGAPGCAPGGATEGAR
jgi:phage shock protein PspC (stress-responsive transcriptional regulator)